MDHNFILARTGDDQDYHMAKLDIVEQLACLPGPVLVIGHTRPDGDAIGSVQAMRLLLEAMGHEAFGFVPDAPEYLAFAVSGLVSELPEAYASVVAVDAATAGDRTPLTPEQFAGKRVVNIDHHKSNNFVADVRLVNSASSSACEVIWDLAQVADAQWDTDTYRAFSEAVYLGIRTDTGSFSFGLTTSHTLRTVAGCIDAGADFERIVQELGVRRLSEMQLMAVALGQAQYLHPDSEGRPQIAFVRLETEHLPEGDLNMQPVLTMLRQVDGVRVAMSMTAQDSKPYRVSLRSNEPIDVASIAESFDGGGHLLAAGARISDDRLDELMNAVKAAIDAAT